MFLEVGLAEVTAIRLHECVDLVRDLALVIGIAPFLANQAQCLCKRGILEDVAFRRRASFAVERVGFEKCAGQIFVKLRPEVPVKRDQLGNGETFLGIIRGRREIVTELELSEFFMELGPGVHRSRHTDREHAARRNRFAVQLVELGIHLLVGQAERRTAATVQAVEFIFLRAVDDREQIAAHAVRDGLH